MANSLPRQSTAVVEIHWRPTGDRRVACTGCEWMQIERTMNAAKKAAKLHVDLTSHTVELHRQQYKLIRPEARNG